MEKENYNPKYYRGGEERRNVLAARGNDMNDSYASFASEYSIARSSPDNGKPLKLGYENLE